MRACVRVRACVLVGVYAYVLFMFMSHFFLASQTFSLIGLIAFGVHSNNKILGACVGLVLN